MTFFRRGPNTHKIGDKVKFEDKVVMTRVKNGKADVAQIVREGTVVQIIPYGGYDYLVIECYCGIDYDIFMKAHTIVRGIDE